MARVAMRSCYAVGAAGYRWEHWLQRQRGRAFAGAPARPLDKERMKALMLRVVDDVSGALSMHLLYIGDRLGLFRSLAEASRREERLRAEALADALALDGRLVEEWLLAATTHGYTLFA